MNQDVSSVRTVGAVLPARRREQPFDHFPGEDAAQTSVRVVLADDHVLLRQGLRVLLQSEGFAVVGEAGDGREAVRIAQQTQPDFAVLDVMMPLLNGLDVVRELRRVSPHTKSLLLTMHRDDSFVMESLRAGVKGYLLKSQAIDDLVRAIREVSKGAFYLSPGISQAVVEAYLARTELPPDPLTAREREVLQLVAEGKTTKKVATLLGISVKTAESHRNRIMEKLNIHDTASLVRYSIRRGLIEP